MVTATAAVFLGPCIPWLLVPQNEMCALLRLDHHLHLLPGLRTQMLQDPPSLGPLSKQDPLLSICQSPTVTSQKPPESLALPASLPFHSYNPVK